MAGDGRVAGHELVRAQGEDDEANEDGDDIEETIWPTPHINDIDRDSSSDAKVLGSNGRVSLGRTKKAVVLEVGSWPVHSVGDGTPSVRPW